MQGVSAVGVRFGSWLCLVLGVAFLIAAGALGALAIQQAMEISAYHHARACVAGEPGNADCLQTVHGTVAGVTEDPGAPRIPAQYSLDVRTASTTLHLTFSSDSPMLGYAVNGDVAVVTMWRGVPVSVTTGGWSEATTSVPDTALASDLGNSAKTGGIGVFFVFGAFAARRNRRAGGAEPLTRPVLATMMSALLLGSIVVTVGGWALGGKPSRLGPDLAATGAGLIVVLGLSAWLGVSVKRRASQSRANFAGVDGVAGDAHDLHVPVLPPVSHARIARTPLRTRSHTPNWARVGAATTYCLLVLLPVGVVFGVFLTIQDGPHARAFRQAPACVGETNLASCVGDFPAVINGVRAPANGANGADVSYVTNDGAINTWVSFGGDTATVVRMASADEAARTQLRIKVWRRAIIGAELGGRWQWAWDNPPGNTVPSVFLAVSFGLLLLVVRLRIHLRAGSRANRQRLLIDDLGQVAAASGSVALLAYGFWPGAILALAVLLWLALSAKQSAQGGRVPLAALHSS